jgi:glutathione-regulated potassium-efflux system protein KefB
MAAETHALDLLPVVGLLAAGIAAVALFRRLGLGSVLGYLVAGLLIGPHGLALFTDTVAILHIGELGVVMFLFVIGLEMQPSRLWLLRRQIFGLGLVQVLACGTVLTGVGLALGWPPLVALVGALGFTLSSTAIVMQLLEERGEAAAVSGQKVISVLLLEDLAIVPLLALVAFLAPAGAVAGGSRLLDIGIGVATILALLIAGRWLLNPLFRLLAAARAREVMTAAALLVVLGSALLMQLGGLTMAMGAFLAGVLLSESTFRHQLEADIEPFRGILMGLFFVSVGMALDLVVVGADWQAVALGVVAFMMVKTAVIYAVARATGSLHGESVHRALLMAQGSEFSFVLYGAAAASGLFSGPVNAVFTTIVILSMALTPLAVLALRWLMPVAQASLDGIETPDNLHGSVLIVGFGRFGQVTSQSLLARDFDVTIIDTDIEMIRGAADFGFKVYYGDGTRLDVLQACGAGHARAIAVCVDDKEAASRIAHLVRAQFPHLKLLVRAYDREHALQLIHAGVDLHMRETVESALLFGGMALRALGVPDQVASDTVAEVRRRDLERLEMEVTGGIYAGRDLMLGNAPKPAPLTTPRRPTRPLTEETAAVTDPVAARAAADPA